jgi:hypothetical protein
MSEADESELRRKAQGGKAVIMDAVVEFLKLHAGTPFSRTEIERRLGLESEYTVSEGGKSYKGALASMLLSKLAEERRIEREGAKRQKKLYLFPKPPDLR